MDLFRHFVPAGGGAALTGALALGLALACSATARAHISLEAGGTHLSRYGDDEIKDGPCGRAGGGRGENVYRYRPGETITIRVRETIAHPGYFRIAFDADGDDDFLEPRSVAPVDNHRACLSDPNDQCGSSDFYNNDSVLLDNLDPHVANLIFSPAQTYTWEVTLPDIECDNCTLQIIQVMEDTVHGPYCPRGQCQEGNYIEDIYHQCIDLVLEADADSSDNPAPVPVAREVAVPQTSDGLVGSPTTAAPGAPSTLDGGAPTVAGFHTNPALTGPASPAETSGGCQAGAAGIPSAATWAAILSLCTGLRLRPGRRAHRRQTS